MVCQETLCKTPQRIGYYAAGPALEGTFCGGKKVSNVQKFIHVITLNILFTQKVPVPQKCLIILKILITILLLILITLLFG